eukprot:CAMPEP_0115737096 /NCGR_PEP_ID=MMETSP0272-20121206/87616_1 /TAXON_ID=71861 /ORGANISM="Scrippsiella trochoidea, Strain CCMP3099" /LENGTH=98 /DNA_ID=CAMNT_0003181337 /DNA_START=84 /DNA_END=380 /DNA_ORIENTATION=+
MRAPVDDAPAVVCERRPRPIQARRLLRSEKILEDLEGEHGMGASPRDHIERDLTEGVRVRFNRWHGYRLLQDLWGHPRHRSAQRLRMWSEQAGKPEVG